MFVLCVTVPDALRCDRRPFPSVLIVSLFTNPPPTHDTVNCRLFCLLSTGFQTFDIISFGVRLRDTVENSIFSVTKQGEGGA